MGSTQLWKTSVNGILLWAPLQPRTKSRIDEYLDYCLPEVIRYDCILPSERGRTFGYINHSRYDLDVALAAAAVALYLVKLRLWCRSQYDYSLWHLHFDSESEADQ